MNPKTLAHQNRKHALENNERFYEGRPCRKCGGTQKYAIMGQCVECRKARDSRQYRKDLEGNRARSRINAKKSRDNNIEKYRIKARKSYVPEKSKLNYPRVRNNQLRRKYGITLEQYNELHKKQNGLCAICGKPEKSKNRTLAVDHCHDSGVVRELLCSPCNTGIGSMKEDETILLNAIEYLRRHKCSDHSETT